MKQEITAQVVMLPQSKTGWNKGDVLSDLEGHLKIATYDRETCLEDWKAQHLYFISTDPNEEIKEGEICLRDYGMGHELVTYKSEYGNTCRKIIASTDPSLGLPIIPTTWIRNVYVLSNGSIKEVELLLEAKYDVVTWQFSRYDLSINDNNEVEIVDEPTLRQYNEAVQKIKDGFLTGEREEQMIALLKKPINQELEDAAKAWGYPKPDKPDFDSHETAEYDFMLFSTGYKAKEQQSANDASEFAIWTHKNLWTPINGDGLWYNKNKVYQYKTECLTTKQLYELWHTNQKKSTMY